MGAHIARNLSAEPNIQLGPENLARPDYLVCSDTTPAGSLPYPRVYGAFPRLLGRLRRGFGGLSLEAIVHRMTDRTAQRFGLPRRGRVERG